MYRQEATAWLLHASLGDTVYAAPAAVARGAFWRTVTTHAAGGMHLSAMYLVMRTMYLGLSSQSNCRLPDFQSNWCLAAGTAGICCYSSKAREAEGSAAVAMGMAVLLLCAKRREAPLVCF